MEEKLYNISETAAMLGVSKNTLRNWDKSGVFKSILTYGNHRRYRLSDIQSFQKDGKKNEKT